MADTKVSALTAATLAAAANEMPVNEAGTSKKATVTQLRALVIERSAAASMTAGPYITWLVLAANSSDSNGQTVMTINTIPVGRYHLYCQLICQLNTSEAFTNAVSFSGTTTQWLMERRVSTTGQTAATAAASEAAASAVGNIYESQGRRTPGAIGAGAVSVDAVNSDMMVTLEGVFVVSVTGNLTVNLAGMSNQGRAMQGSFLELKQLS